jgi:hypothetical protein
MQVAAGTVTHRLRLTVTTLPLRRNTFPPITRLMVNVAQRLSARCSAASLVTGPTWLRDGGLAAALAASIAPAATAPAAPTSSPRRTQRRTALNISGSVVIPVVSDD